VTAWASDPAYQRAARRAVAYDGQGKIKIFASCFACARVVGRYERGATIALARELHCSPDTVEARARAAVTYRELFRHFRTNPEVQRRLRVIRRQLGYSHFAEAGRWLRADIHPLTVFAQLDTAAREGAGTRVMGRHQNGHTVLELHAYRLDDRTVDELRDRYGTHAAILVLPDPYEDYQGKTMKVSV
jgi:hypothetical protein